MMRAPAPMSLTAPISSGAGPGPSLTNAAASSAVAPLETAIATASARADRRSDGSATAAAAYVRPVSSRTAAPSAEPTRALAARASVMIFRSSGPSAAAVTTRPSLVPAGQPGRVPGEAATTLFGELFGDAVGRWGLARRRCYMAGLLPLPALHVYTTYIQRISELSV